MIILYAIVIENAGNSKIYHVIRNRVTCTIKFGVNLLVKHLREKSHYSYYDNNLLFSFKQQN